MPAEYIRMESAWRESSSPLKISQGTSRQQTNIRVNNICKCKLGSSKKGDIRITLEKSETLRKQAERALSGQTVNLKKLSTEDVQHIVHELQVHQIELEMQN